MPKDPGFLQPHRAKAAVIVVMQVRSADPACRQTQAQLAVAGAFVGTVFDPQVVGGMDDDGAHHSTGVGRGCPEKCAVRLSRTSLPMACRVS